MAHVQLDPEDPQVDTYATMAFREKADRRLAPNDGRRHVGHMFAEILSEPVSVDSAKSADADRTVRDFITRVVEANLNTNAMELDEDGNPGKRCNLVPLDTVFNVMRPAATAALEAVWASHEMTAPTEDGPQADHAFIQLAELFVQEDAERENMFTRPGIGEYKLITPRCKIEVDCLLPSFQPCLVEP